jgi:hypothetical protein
MANDKTATNVQDQSFPPPLAPAQTLLGEAIIEEQSLRLIIDRIPGQIAARQRSQPGDVELDVSQRILPEVRNEGNCTLSFRCAHSGRSKHDPTSACNGH